MNIIRKLLTLLTNLLLITGLISSVQASIHNKEDNNIPEKIQLTYSNDYIDNSNSESETESEENNEAGNNTSNSNENEDRLENAIRKSEILKQQINNPDVGNQIHNMIQETERFRKRTSQLLSNFQTRSLFLKLLVGPDYKNTGELKSEIVRLQSQIQQTIQLRNALENEEDIRQIDEIISDLNKEVENIQSKLNEELSAPSLFGWLVKLLKGY